MTQNQLQRKLQNFFNLGDVYDQGSRVNLGGGKSAFRKQTTTTTARDPSITGGFEKGDTQIDMGTKGGQTTTDNMIAGLDDKAQTRYKEAGIGTGADVPKDAPKYGQRVYDRATSSQYITSSMVTAGVDFGIRLLQGEDAMDAATSAADTGIGTYIGGSLGGQLEQSQELQLHQSFLVELFVMNYADKIL